MGKLWIGELYPQVQFMTAIVLSPEISLSERAFRKWQLHSTLPRMLQERLLKTLPTLQSNSSVESFPLISMHNFKWKNIPKSSHFQTICLPSWQVTVKDNSMAKNRILWSTLWALQMKHKMFFCIDFTTSCNNHSSLLDWLLKLQHTFFRATHLFHQMSSGTKYLFLSIL